MLRGLPVEIRAERPEPETTRVQRPGLWLDRIEGRQLVDLIAHHAEPEGVKLTHRRMKRYGFRADVRRADLLDQSIQRGKGFERRTTGGKTTVWLRPEVADRLVEKVRGEEVVR
jgi:hypothetical protein